VRACLWLVLLALLAPLSDTRAGGAQAAYAHTWRLFQRGYLAASQQEAEWSYRQFQLSAPDWAARFKLLQAESMLYRGLYDEALRVLNGYHGQEDADGTVEKLAIESVAYTHLQDASRASQLLAQADGLCKSADLEACGDILVARATLALNQGQFADARRLYVQSLELARRRQDKWLEVRASINLGYMALQKERYDEAVDWSKSAYQSALAFDFENAALNAAGNLGWAYYQLGDDERAIDLFVAAEQAAERLGNVGAQFNWLSTESYVYRDSGDLPRSSICLKRALYLARQMHNNADIVYSLEDLAQTALDGDDPDAAEGYLSQLTPAERHGQTTLDAYELVTEGRIAFHHHQYGNAEQFFRRVQGSQAIPMPARLAAAYFLGAVYESQGKSQAAEEQLRSALADYEKARDALKRDDSRLTFGVNADSIYDSYIQLLMRHGRSEEALTLADQSRARTLEQGFETGAASNSVVPQNLDPRQVARKTHANLLFYWRGRPHSYLWEVTEDNVYAYTLPSWSLIASHVASYRKTIVGMRNPTVTLDRDGEYLYNCLIAPARSTLHLDRPVIVLTDGELSQLNFETLLVPGPNPPNNAKADPRSQFHYLIEDMTLASAPSLAMLAASKPAHTSGSKLLIVGNPVTPNSEYPSLPLFGVEAAKIESHFNRRQVSAFTGREATPDAYLSGNPAQYSYIHFVSHAIANRNDPLGSAVVLSRSSTDEDSFKLYARDILQHRIDANIVTISACYGGGVRSYAGEGLVGLSWAFLRAGAHRVVGAIWEVSDNSTPQLMDTFYRGVAVGTSPAVALRQAKLGLLHSGTRFSLPFYWATFQMIERE